METTLLLSGLARAIGGVGMMLVIWVGFFTIYQTIFFAASIPALIWRHEDKTASSRARTRFCIIVPAHNEELLIKETVTALLKLDYPEGMFDVVVVADNCTDRTFDIVRGMNVLGLERHDERLRGKPYAINWVMSRLDLGAYDAFVIIDADTIVDKGFARVLDRYFRKGEKAVQGYFGVLNPDESWLTRLSILPAFLKFRLQFPGKRLLGLSCPLAGNAMGFAREVWKELGWEAFSITENWEYYAILSLHGYRVTPAPDAVIYSQVAKNLQQGQPQRLRWIRGKLSTLRLYAPKLLRLGLRGHIIGIDTVLELARPTHSMLLVLSLLSVISIWLGVQEGLYGSFWLKLGTAMLVLQIVFFLVGFILLRPGIKTWLSLAFVPFYLIWKISISVFGLFTSGDQHWVKTDRHR